VKKKSRGKEGDSTPPLNNGEEGKKRNLCHIRGGKAVTGKQNRKELGLGPAMFGERKRRFLPEGEEEKKSGIYVGRKRSLIRVLRNSVHDEMS